MSGREVKPGAGTLADPRSEPGPALDRPGATTLVEREGRRVQPVPDALRARLEAATGTSLGDVRLHTGPDAHAQAEAHGARAFTIGQDVYFRDGESLDSEAGAQLIAHEVAHTVQNKKTASAPTDAGAGTTSPDDAGEKEARGFAEAIVDGRTPPPLVESLGGAIARDALVMASDIGKKKKPEDQFSGPVTWSVIGDSFEVRIHKAGDELVTDITYLGPHGVDSRFPPGPVEPVRRQRIPTRRRHPPEARKDLPYVTKVVARSGNTLTFDLFGDGVELLVVRDNCDPDNLAKFDRRTHEMNVAINGYPMTPATFEVRLPTGDGKGGADGDRDAIASRKIKLLKEEHTLRARRHGDSDSVVLGIVSPGGDQQVIVPLPNGASKRLAVELLENDGRTLSIDLDCDGKPDATLIHTMRQVPDPDIVDRYRGGHLGRLPIYDPYDPKPFYEHQLTAYDVGGVLLGRMVQRMPGYPPGVIPPEQDARKSPAPEGAARAATDGAQQPDLLPGQVPEAFQGTGRDWELRIDGDGDRTNELLLRFIPTRLDYDGAPKEHYMLRTTQISTGISSEAGVEMMGVQARSMAKDGPRLLRATDGHTPGVIELGRDMQAKMSFGVPLGNAQAQEGHTHYEFTMGPNPVIVFEPPQESGGKAPLVQNADSQQSSKNVGAVLTADLALTEYQDKFRITVQQTTVGWALLGLSALQDGTQIGGIHTRLDNIKTPRLERAAGHANKVSFLVDPSNGIDTLDVTSTLDPPMDPQRKPIKDIPPTSHRDHRITLFGRGIQGDLTATFPVRHGRFVPHGWDKDPDAQLAAGSADAVGVLQEQAKHPNFAEYKIQIDAALDSAVTNAVEKDYISPSDAEAWGDLRTSMILIEAQANSGAPVSEAQVTTAKTKVAQLDSWLEFETNQADQDNLYKEFQWYGARQARRTRPGTPGPSETYSGSVMNPYTGQTFTVTDGILGEEKDNSTTYGRLVKTTLADEEWPKSFKHYGKFRDGVRKWLKTRYDRDTKKGEQSAGAAQLEYLGKMAEQTGKLDKIQAERLALDSSIDEEVLAAAKKGVIRGDIGGTWTKLREEMLLLTAQTSSAQPDKELIDSGVTHTGAIASWLASETENQFTTVGSANVNEYTGKQNFNKGNDEWITVSKGHGAKLTEHLQAGNVTQAGQVYNRLRDGVVRWIVEKYKTDPQFQDDAAAKRLGGLQKQRKSKRDVMRIAAVYQADESFEKMPDADGYKKEDFGKYKTVPLTVFVWAEDNKWHIRDVTNPARVWNPDTVDFNDEDQPPEALFNKLDHSRHLPKGHISYQLPDGTGNRIRLDSPKPWYDYVKEWAMYIGLAALAVLATAATFGAAAAVAIPVFIATSASAALSIVGSAGELYDAHKEGFIDNDMIFMNVLDIASNLAALGVGAAGKLTMGAQAAALAEKQGTGVAWAGMRAFAAKAGSMAYRPLMAANIAGSAISAFVMSDAMITQLGETEGIKDFGARLLAQAKIIATWAATTGMVILSMRGDLPAFGKGAPKITLDNVNGRMVARLADVHVGKTVVDLPNPKNVNEHAGARWQAEELEHTARSGTGEAKADATAALSEAEFQAWYGKWLADPKRIGADGNVRVPAGTPEGYAERAQKMVARGDAQLHQQAFETADEVGKIRAAADEHGLDMNPSDDAWPATRKKLEEELEGEWGKERTRKALDRYENARLGAKGDPADFVSQRAKVDKVLPESEIERIKDLYPDTEIHVTGDLTAKQAARGKGPDAVEVAVVVPNDTLADQMSAMEQRATSHRVQPDPEYAKATGKNTLGLRVKVMTEDQFFGMATASRKGKAPPTYVRIDQSVGDAIDAGVPVRAHSPTHYAVEPDQIARARAHMAEKPDANGRVGKLQYDPETNSVYFEVRGGTAGARIRIESPLPPKITNAGDLGHTNRIVGQPVRPGEAHDIMRRLTNGDLTALERTGVHVNGADPLPPGTEFGLGELPNGQLVIIRGELRAVDWSTLPGVKPLAHTHPSVEGNNLQGRTKISVAELATPEGPGDSPSINRALIYPTPEDLATVLARKVKEHTVLTSFHVRDGQVFKPDATNGTGTPLDFVIRNIEEVGKMPDGKPVYKASIVGVAGGKQVIPARETWGVVDPDGYNSFIDLRQPAGMVPNRTDVGSGGVKVPESSTTRAKIDKADVETIAREEMDRQGIKADVTIAEPLPPEDFKARFSSAKGKAVFVLEPDGRGKIYTTNDARPIDVRAEVQHVKQMQDPAMGGEIRRLHGPDLEKSWDQMAAADRLEQFRRKLNIEIDAHESMLDELRGKERKEIAGQLQDLRKLQKRAEAITPAQLAEMNAGLRPMEPFLKDPAWLFTKQRGQRGDAHADAVTTFPKDEKGMRLPDEGMERSAAYTNLKNVETVRQIGTEWQENWQITSGYEGTCTKIAPNADGGTSVEITDASGTAHTYDLEPGSQVLVEVDPNQPISRGTPLGNEPPRRYRYVEIEFKSGKGDKSVDRRQEIRTSDGSWVQRGSESTNRGKAMEKAARAQADEQLADRKKTAEAKGQYFDSKRLVYPQGSGGFDDTLVQFTGSPEKPKAKLRIREVKDYPDRHVPLADFTAILPPANGGNLDVNMKALRRQVDGEARRLTDNVDAQPEGSFDGLTREQVFAIRDAIRKNEIDFEIVLGPDTLIGREGAKGSSVIDSLRKDLKGYFDGKDVLKRAGGKYSPERVSKEHADKVKPAVDTDKPDPKKP